MDLQFRSGHHHDEPELRLLEQVAVPVRPEAVALARAVIRDSARRAELPDDTVDDLLIAGSEAVTNAVEAQLEAGNDTPLQVRCLAGPGCFALEVIDAAGPGFDVDALAPRPPLADPGHLDVERGWGIQLMRELVDRVEFDATAAGTTVRLVVEGR